MQVVVAAALATEKFSATLLQTTHNLLPLLHGVEICCFTLLGSYIKFFALWKLKLIRKVWDMRSEVLKNGLVQSGSSLIFFH